MGIVVGAVWRINCTEFGKGGIMLVFRRCLDKVHR